MASIGSSALVPGILGPGMTAASTVVKDAARLMQARVKLAELRERFKVPFVGTVPAIKPACASSVSRLVTVLGTEATVRREYPRALIRDFSQGCAVTLVGSPHLAEFAEAELKVEFVPQMRP